MSYTYVNHYRNSFIEIIDNGIRILLDPWVNTANEGAWAGSVDGKNYILKTLKKKDVDYIYISHLHTDHFDKSFLLDLKAKQKKKFKIIIKNFKKNPLYDQISKIIDKDQIIEILDYQKIYLTTKSYFVILPQISVSNTPSELIKYDLDTSCVYKSNNIQIYNQVDNPYSEKDISEILKNLKKIKIENEFDICFIPYCAASEYPHMYFNLDRIKEKKKLINSRLKKFFKITSKFNTKIVVPSGGTYKLDAIFTHLNKYTAIPNFSIIKKKLKILGSKKFNLVDSESKVFISKNRKMLLKKNNHKNFFVSKISKKFKPSYEKNIKEKFKKEKILSCIHEVEKNLSEYSKNLYKKTNTSLELVIYNVQPSTLKNPINHKKTVKHSINFGNNKRKKIRLKIHIYYKIFLAIINKMTSWNELQAQCMFERFPNVYDPDTLLWMNFFKKR